MGKENKWERASDEIHGRRCVLDVASETKSEYEKKESHSEGREKEKRTCVGDDVADRNSLFPKAKRHHNKTHTKKYKVKEMLTELLFR